MIDLKQVLGEVEKAKTLKDLEDLKSVYLGKKGKISEIMQSIKDASVDEKKKIGKYINEIKEKLNNAILSKKEIIETETFFESMKNEKLDLTLPVNFNAMIGKNHPISKVYKEVYDILHKFSFEFVSGPEIETDFFNFSALNIHEFHPARQMHDTFYLKNSDMLLRTHTSPVQVRSMLQRHAPLKVFTCGTVYRNDYDATHTPMFNQIEILYIDKNVTFANMKWFCMEFCKAFFERDDIKIRLRPSYFPFTEPSAELDIAYRKADDGQYIIGEGDDWLEIVGCGMVHPNVLKSGGVNPDEYQGFAFGFGVERLTSLKYGIPDLRGYFDYDVKWGDCFGFSPFCL